MNLANPLTDPVFLPTLQVIVLLFILGFGLVLYFGRKDLKTSLTGELGKRFLGWLLIAPLFMLAAFVGGIVAAAILLVFFFRIVSEYVAIVGVQGDYAIYLYALIPVTVIVARFIPDLYFTLPAFSILLLSLIPILTRKIDDLYNQMSFAGRGYLYLVWSVAHLILLKQLAGTGMVVLVGIGVALSDVMQYTIGKLLGKHIISSEVNPRKAWEGLIGDFLGASMAVYLLRFALPPEFTLPYLIALIVLIGIGSAWGDLASSLVKRVAGVKDWGHIIPGHGGLLDRANSMVIVIPLVYYFTYLALVYS